jgi:murein DD-endopeptidase MepM/ murein hydrolase activator NlpD
MHYKTKWSFARLLALPLTIIAVLVVLLLFVSRPTNSTGQSLSGLKVTNGIASAIPSFRPEPKPIFIMPENVNTYDIVIMPGDTLAKRLNEFKVSAQVVHEILQDEIAQPLLSKIFPGQTLKVTTDESGQLHQLEQKIDETQSLIVKYIDENYTAEVQTKPVTTYVKYAHATIEDSMFGAAMRAGISDNTTMELANIFGWDIDFALDIRPGDLFSVLYEERYVNEQKISPGNILAAEFVNQGRIYQAIRFEDANGNVDYYTPNGDSLRKAFLRTPVKFTRISSHFNPKRKHPILHTIRAHNGVDYAAPTGTPVKAAGDGKVTFTGVCGGYGNMVMIQHGRRYTTLYAHLHNFAKGIRKGSKVKQGDVIGYVGMTGLASGPHLHYEFRVDGKHHNPLTVELPGSDPIAEDSRQSFLAHAKNLMGQLDHHHQTEMAHLESLQHRMLD